MKKGMVLLFAFILTVLFSAEGFADARTNFGVKHREKKVTEQPLTVQAAKEAPAKKVPVVQPVAEATVAATTAVVGATAKITDAMYSSVVDGLLGGISKAKETRPAAETKTVSEKPGKIKQASEKARPLISETRPQEPMRITEAPVNKERVKREVTPKRRKAPGSDIK